MAFTDVSFITFTENLFPTNIICQYFFTHCQYPYFVFPSETNCIILKKIFDFINIILNNNQSSHG